jgi:uncharacterized membrane protein YfcA
MDISQPLLALPLESQLMIGAALYIAYCIFGIAGFGAALVAGPTMAHFMPMTTIVPLLALLDFTASATNLVKDKKDIATHEAKALLVFMAIGSLVGAYLLFNIRPDIMILLFGLFAIFYSLYASAKALRKQSLSPFSTAWRAAFGTIGGTFSAMFGSGGFIYSIYIMSRIKTKEAVRATQSTLIGFSTLIRIIIFAVAGIYSHWSLWLAAGALLPIMWLGIVTGRSIAHRLNREQFMLLVYAIVLISGISLIIRYTNTL